MTAPFKNYTGVERAAVLMMLVGEEEAAAILSQLDPEEVRQLGSAMFAVADVSENDVDFVLDDFVGRARENNSIRFDPRQQITAVMNRALGEEKAGSVLARISPPEQPKGLELLEWLDAPEIAAMIEKEHPQIAAVTIANLAPDVAAQVLEILPDSIQPEILHRIAKLGPVTQEAIETLRQLIAARGVSAKKAPAGLVMGGTREAAKIMSSARKTTEQRVMPKLAKIDKEVARAIEEAMFVFDNLLELDDKNLGTLLRNIDSDVLVRSIKPLDEETRNRFYGCMSSRAADGIKDELEQRGPMKMADVMEAQKVMIGIAKGLSKDGTIVFASKGGSGGDDDYV